MSSDFAGPGPRHGPALPAFWARPAFALGFVAAACGGTPPRQEVATPPATVEVRQSDAATQPAMASITTPPSHAATHAAESIAPSESSADSGPRATRTSGRLAHRVRRGDRHIDSTRRSTACNWDRTAWSASSRCTGTKSTSHARTCAAAWAHTAGRSRPVRSDSRRCGPTPAPAGPKFSTGRRTHGPVRAGHRSRHRAEKSGVAYGGRTHNLRNHNPLLCRLS
jgi:hypothetical protein